MSRIRNFKGIQFEALRRIVDPSYNGLHDELSDAHYGPSTVSTPRGMAHDRSQGWLAEVYRSCWDGKISNRFTELPPELQKRFDPATDVLANGLLTKQAVTELFRHLHGQWSVSHHKAVIDEDSSRPANERERVDKINPTIDDQGTTRHQDLTAREQILKDEGIDITALANSRRSRMRA